MVEKLADQAEAGYDVNEIIARRPKRGRPRLGTAPSTVESVRLDPDLKERLVQRAEQEGVPVSEVIREALRPPSRRELTSLHYCTKSLNYCARHGPEVVEEARRQVEKVIDREGVFTVSGDTGAFVGR